VTVAKNSTLYTVPIDQQGGLFPSDFGSNPFAASEVVCLVSLVPPPSVAILAPPSAPDHPVVPDLPSAFFGGAAGSAGLVAWLSTQSPFVGACPVATVANARRLQVTNRRLTNAMAKTSKKGLNLQEPSEVPAFAVQDENITRFCSAN